MEDEEVRAILDSYLTAEEFWEELFDIEIIDSHYCSQIPEDNASKLVNIKSDDSKWRDWYLLNARLATEYDVELGEAQRIADVQSASMVVIKFCPFCGTRLN